MADTSWSGAVGDYLDPAQWTPGDVPLYGSDTTATVSAGTATLSNAEPNGITLTLGRPPGGGAGASPVLALSNAALGPDMTLDARGFAVLGVDGYDTAYGTINVVPSADEQGADGQGPGNGNALVVNIGAGSQLNQEGTVSVINSSLITGGPGTLNNDGQIFIGPGSVGVFGGTFPQSVTGSGTIVVDGGSVGLYDAASTQTVDLLGGTLSTAVSLQAAIKDWNNDGALMFNPSVSIRSVQFNQTSDAGGDLQLLGAAGQVGDLHLLGSYATADFTVGQQTQQGTSISVSGHPLASA
jgi:hypothetical protein